jgi:hypothetical protein
MSALNRSAILSPHDRMITCGRGSGKFASDALPPGLKPRDGLHPGRRLVIRCSNTIPMIVQAAMRTVDALGPRDYSDGAVTMVCPQRASMAFGRESFVALCEGATPDSTFAKPPSIPRFSGRLRPKGRRGPGVVPCDDRSPVSHALPEEARHPTPPPPPSIGHQRDRWCVELPRLHGPFHISDRYAPVCSCIPSRIGSR